MNDVTVALETRGFAIVRGVLPGAAVASLRQSFDTLRARRLPMSRQMLYTHREPATPSADFTALMDQWFNPHRIAGDGSTARTMAEMNAWLGATLGRNLLAFQDVLMAKRPSHHVFPWHQDEPFWPVDCAWGVVAWCALDPVDRANGGVEFAVGSHRDGLGPAIDLHTGDPQEGVTGDPVDPRKYEVVCPALGPGDAVLFHPRMWHRSGENRREAPRRAWASTWLPPESCWNRDRAPRHPLASRVEQGGTLGASGLFGRPVCDG